MSYNKNKPKCFYCGRIGHISREFYKKKSDEAIYKCKKHSEHFAKENPNFDSKDLRLFVSNVALFAEIDDVDAWFVDSGASIHMTCNKNWYENFKETNNGAHIYLEDDRAYQIKGYGDNPLTLPNGIVRHIRNVVYVPGIKKKLIYVSTITDHNFNVEFFKTHCIVKDLQDHDRNVSSRVRDGGLYKLDVTRKDHQVLTFATMLTETLWRKRYSHINYHDFCLLKKQRMVEGLPMLKNEYVSCEGCALVNMHRDELPSNLDRRKRDLL
jgi:hypothetical protein